MIRKEIKCVGNLVRFSTLVPGSINWSAFFVIGSLWK